MIECIQCRTVLDVSDKETIDNLGWISGEVWQVKGDIWFCPHCVFQGLHAKHKENIDG